MAFCSNCGNKLDENVNFCANCGAKNNRGLATEANIVDTAQLKEQQSSNSSSVIKKGVKIACNYDGVLIQVVNALTKESLYIDGLLVDQHYTGFNAIYGKTLILKSINYPFKSGAKTIQVFVKSGLVSVKYMLCIDGNYIAGDKI
jgi:predicted amidophosphoribosyltransferase